MLDILDDSCDGLEIDRIKDKIRAIWSKVIVAEYNNEYGDQKDDSEDYVSLDEYITDNQLYFPGDTQPENEMSDIAKMLEDMFDPKEELDSVKSEAKAPTYNGKQLSANNEKGKIEATKYEVKHTTTKTPGDSQSSVKSSTYDAPTGGTIATRTDSKVKRSYAPMIQKIVEELLDLEDKRNVGRRKQLFRL
jgi:hypothetical protein